MSTSSTALPTNTLHLSVLQHEPTPADISASLKRLRMAAQQAAEKGSSLLVSPECGMTGYDISEDDARSVAFARNGDVALELQGIARQHSIAIMYGFMEADGDMRYNSVQLIDAKGQTQLHYRKTHLWGDLDRRLFRAGDTLAPVITLNGWNISTLICYDVEFPETVRTLALAGAHLILVPTALMQPFRFVADKMVAVRAAESQVYLAYANLVGRENNTVYEGCSTVASPAGDIVAQAPDNAAQLMHVTLDSAALAHSRETVPYLNNRRPELYAALAADRVR